MTESAAVRRGGTLTWGQAANNSIVDPARFTGGGTLSIVGHVCESLVSIDRDGDIHPGLATSWRVEDDAKRFTFALRDGVTFHDGSLLDAHAAKRSFERVADPRTKATQASALLGPLRSAEAPDTSTLVLTFEEPNPLLFTQLWRPPFGIVALRQLDSVGPDDLITKPIGTGPYRFVGRTTDAAHPTVTLQANPHYTWGPETLRNRRTPYITTVEMRQITDAPARVATLESGENLIIDNLPEADYVRLKDDQRFAFLQVARKGVTLGFNINTRKPPTNDVAVRQALSWAVDRVAITQTLFFGVHRPTVGPLSEGVWGRLDELEKTMPYSGDKKRAAQILDGAGWNRGPDGIRMKNGRSLSLLMSLTDSGYETPAVKVARAVQPMWREIGIDVRIELLPRPQWFEFVRSYKHHLCESAGTNYDPDELRLRFTTPLIGSINYANCSDATLDVLLEQGARQPLGSATRRRTYEAAQRRMVEIAPMVPILTMVRTTAMSKRVHDFTMGPAATSAIALSDTWLGD